MHSKRTQARHDKRLCGFGLTVRYERKYRAHYQKQTAEYKKYRDACLNYQNYTGNSRYSHHNRASHRSVF